MKRLHDGLWRLPGPRALAEEAATAARDGRSVLVLIPVSTDEEAIRSVLMQTLRRKEIHPDILPADPDPSSAVNAYLARFSLSGVVPPVTCDIRKLVRAQNVPQHLSPEHVPFGAEDAWISFALSWAEASRGLADERIPPALFVVSHSTSAPPPAHPWLHVIYWWGVPSALELRLLLRDGTDPGTPEARWREHLIPSLCATDLSLAERLCDVVVTEQHSRVVEVLAEYGREMGWTQEGLKKEGIEEASRPGVLMSMPRTSVPPSRFERLWAQGVLVWTPERGLEVHSAALAVMGWRERVLHRLWRAQTELLLPLLDAYRIRICEELTESLGTDWPYRHEEPSYEDERALVRESPLTTQYGHLARLVKHRPEFSEDKRRFGPTLSHCKRVRDDLAHCRVVEYKQFTRIPQFL